MRFGIFSGILWGLDTVVLGMALALSPFVGTPEALLWATFVAAFFHDAFCAIWLLILMILKGRLKDTWRGLKTKSGLVVVLAALLGGPLGMSGYMLAINNIGPAYTAIISAFYPAVGAVLACVFLHERMNARQVAALMVTLVAVMLIGWLSSESSSVENAALGLTGAALCVFGWGSEAVLCAWGMRDDAVDNQVALQIRETTSALIYGLVLIPLLGAAPYASQALPTEASAIIGVAALAGTMSYLCYYRGISVIGAARGMALNISYSAWAIMFSVILLQSVPSALEIALCATILIGTVLAATSPQDLKQWMVSIHVKARS